MKLVPIGMVCCVAAVAAMGQQTSGVNTSRSNVKNNLKVVQGPGGKVRCTVSDKDCTKEQVEQLSKALAGKNAADAQRRMHDKWTTSEAVSITTVALGPDGSLVCGTKDGKTSSCTAAHLGTLNSAAAAMPAANDPTGNPGVGLGKKTSSKFTDAG